MQEWIEELDDATAVRVLRTYAGTLARSQGFETELNADARTALVEHFNAPPTHQAPSDGEVAKRALALLADDPEIQPRLRAMVERQAEQFGFGPGAVALAVAAIIALQTHVKFQRKADGAWSLSIEKKPSQQGLVKMLAQAIVRLKG